MSTKLAVFANKQTYSLCVGFHRGMARLCFNGWLG